MSKVLFSNNATTVLAVGIGVGATSCTGSAGTGALFPAPNPAVGSYFFATFVKASNVNVKEIVRCTQRTTDTFAITPTVNAWLAGDTFAILSPAEALEAFVQFDDLQGIAGGYAIDTGAANAYVVALTPAVGTPVPGMPIRWLAAHGNTGPSTFNGAPLVLTDGSALSANDVVANGVYVSTWNSARNAYQLNFTILVTFGQLAGQIQDAQVPYSAVSQFLAELLANAALTGDPTAPTAAPGTNTVQIATTAFANEAAALAAAAAGNPGASLGEPGYQQFLSGFIYQWGTVTSTGGNVGVGFAKNFPNQCFGVHITPSISGFTGGVVSVSDSGFVADTFRTASGQTLYWSAWGH